MSHFTIARIVAAGSLVLALGPMPYAYYSLMRLLVFGVSAYAAYQAFQKDAKGWLWVFGIMAVVFNPLVPVVMRRESWAGVDVLCAVLILGSFGSRRLRSDPAGPKRS